MDLFDTVRIAWDEAFGTRGAMRNCRTELRRRDEVDAAVRQLCERLPAPAETLLEHRASA